METIDFPRQTFQHGDRVRVATTWLRTNLYAASDQPWYSEVGVVRWSRQAYTAGQYVCVDFPSQPYVRCNSTSLEHVS
jgi:hypothetical protein